jgi:hypothetical protein
MQAHPRTSYPTQLSAVLILALCGFWLWVEWCRFPWAPWNDIRLFPAFMAAAGESVYSPHGHGIIGTWMYGPMPIWLFQPATWMPDIVTATLTAGIINIGLQVTAIACACLCWPAPDLNRWHRLMAFGMVVAVWPEAGWRFIQADNYAVSFGLISGCFLLQSHEKPAYGWFAAVAAAMSVACKQTSLGIPFAQLTWVAVVHGRHALKDHSLRLLAAGAAILVITLFTFDPAGLWYTMITLPGSLPFAESTGERLVDLLPLLLVHGGIPPLLFFAWRKKTAPCAGLKLACFLWVFSLPLGAVSILKIGGTINSLQGLQLALPALALGIIARLASRPWVPLLPMIFVGIILCLRLTLLPRITATPLVDHLKEGVLLARTYPDALWFPWNPLVTYYAEKKFSHVEDGFYVRQLAGRPVTYAHAREYLPVHFAGIAEPVGVNGWGISEKMLAARVEEQTAGSFWRVRTRANPNQSTTP